MTIDGALDDFGMWEIGATDPAITFTLEAVGSTNLAWLRSYVTATRPLNYFYQRGAGSQPDQYLWRKAAYAVVAPWWDNVATTKRHALTKVQFEQQGPTINLLPPDARTMETELVYGGYDSSGAVHGLAKRVNDTDAYTGEWCLEVTAATGGTTVYALPVVGMAPAKGGAGYQYGCSARFKSSVVGATFGLAVEAFDGNFESLGAAIPDTDSIYVADEWQYLDTAIDAVPAGTKYVAVTFYIDASVAAGTKIRVDDVTISSYNDVNGRPSTPQTYDDPRRVIVQLRGDAVNYVRNSLPEEQAPLMWKGWDLLDNGYAVGMAVDTSRFLYTNAMKLTADTGMVEIGVKSMTDPLAGFNVYGVPANVPFVASAWVSFDADIADATIRVKGEAEFTGLLASEVLALYPNDTRYVTTDSNGNRWIQVFCPFTLPEGAVEVGGGVVSVEVVGTFASPSAGGEEFWLNAVQVRQGTVPGKYVHHSLFTSQKPDYYREVTGTATDGYWVRSHHYEGYRTRRPRAEAVVKENLPAGTDYAIRVAEPPSVKRILRDVYGRPLP